MDALIEKLKNELYTTQAEVITADLLYEHGEQQSIQHFRRWCNQMSRQIDEGS